MNDLSIYTCPECGHQQPDNFTRCPACGKWLDPAQVAVARTRQEMHSVAPVEPAASATSQPGNDLPRISSGYAEVDRVFGGGICEGSALIISAPPGTGKSTLLMQIAARVAETVGPVLYVSGEETMKQAITRARRIRAAAEKLFILADNGIEEAIHEMNALKAVLVIIDSLQVMRTSYVDNSPGTNVQIREVSNRIIDLAKKSGTPVLVAGQIVKSGEFAGPMSVPHLYDGVFTLDKETLPGFILLRSEKNRFGSTDEVGSFRMIPTGIEEVANPSAEILGNGGKGIIIVAMEGNKTIATEVQVVFLPRGDLSESIVGYPIARLRQIQTVLDQYGIEVPNTIALDVLGAYRIKESSADLAVAIATAYAVKKMPLPKGWSAIGEVALDGKLLPPRKFTQRFRELEVLGIADCIVPVLGSESFAECKKPIVHRATTLREALNMIGLELPTDGMPGRPIEVRPLKAVSAAATARKLVKDSVRSKQKRARHAEQIVGAHRDAPESAPAQIVGANHDSPSTTVRAKMRERLTERKVEFPAPTSERKTTDPPRLHKSSPPKPSPPETFPPPAHLSVHIEGIALLAAKHKQLTTDLIRRELHVSIRKAYQLHAQFVGARHASPDEKKSS